jgi:hypothetical protein
MIFQHTLNQILCGDKTQTRRITHKNEIAVRGRYNQIESVLHNGRVKWCVGNTYAVQPGRGTEQIARIKLHKINSEYITRITTRDAIAEGFDSRREFLQAWETIHGHNSFDLRVWVLTFELIGVINIDKITLNKVTEAMLSRAAG